MIIKKQGQELLLMSQTDHAALAGRLASSWGNKQFEQPALKDAVVLATTRHDDGWSQADARPLYNVDAKRPLHFHEIDAEDHIPLYRRGVLAVADDDPYAGLLVGMHWTGLYRGRWGLQSPKGGLKGHDPGISELQEEAILEEEARWAKAKQSILTEFDRRSSWEAQLWHAYELLQVWDLLSLFVCMAPHDTDEQASVTDRVPVGLTLGSLQQPAGERVIPASTKAGHDLLQLSVQVAEPGLVTLDPFPFAEDISAEVNAVAIPDRDYQGTDDIGQALSQGEKRVVSCTFTRK